MTRAPSEALMHLQPHSTHHKAASGVRRPGVVTGSCGGWRETLTQKERESISFRDSRNACLPAKHTRIVVRVFPITWSVISFHEGHTKKLVAHTFTPGRKRPRCSCNFFDTPRQNKSSVPGAYLGGGGRATHSRAEKKGRMITFHKADGKSLAAVVPRYIR